MWRFPLLSMDGEVMFGHAQLLGATCLTEVTKISDLTYITSHKDTTLLECLRFSTYTFTHDLARPTHNRTVRKRKQGYV